MATIEESGRSQSTVQLLGASETGSNVFFSTADALVAQDTDNGLDIYDARVDGGFPAPVAPPECSGDECQGPLASAPVLLSPGSELQAGGGNVKPATSAPATTKAKPKQAKKKQKKKKGKRKAAARKSKAKLARGSSARRSGKGRK